MNPIRQLIEVQSTDSDDARRRKLLAILLVGLAALALVAIVAITILWFATGSASAGVSWNDFVRLVGSSLAFLFGLAVIFAINRYWSGILASVLFLSFLTIMLAVVDEPKQVVEGRTVFVFTIPILMASVLLRPWASFVLAGVCSVIIGYLAVYIMRIIVPPTPTMVGFFAFAFVSWLSARSLEQALRDLRVLNRELDQRVQDRTRDLAEALVREQAEASKNEAILLSIADGVIVFDNVGRAMVANPAISGMLTKPSAEVVGKDILQLMGAAVSGEDREKVTTIFRDSQAPSAPISLDWGSRTFSMSMAPLRVDSGEVTGSVAVFHDVTREAEINRMKSAFVSMVSHELRTPLGAILGFAEILQQGIHGRLGAEQAKKVEGIMSNVGHLLAIVQDLLDQAKIEAGTLTILDGPVAPAKLVEEVQGNVAKLAEEKGLKLFTAVEPDVPALLRGDFQRLRQVLSNLVTNALKYTEQGEVKVRLYRPDEAHWAMEVTDTGVGISPDAQAYVFDPFRQVTSSLRRSRGGVGLGLSIVKKLVILMGGDIQLTSEVGRGSTFTAILPLIPAPVEQPVPA